MDNAGSLTRPANSAGQLGDSASVRFEMTSRSRCWICACRPTLKDSYHSLENSCKAPGPFDCDRHCCHRRHHGCATQHSSLGHRLRHTMHTGSILTLCLNAPYGGPKLSAFFEKINPTLRRFCRCNLFMIYRTRTLNSTLGHGPSRVAWPGNTREKQRTPIYLSD